jgi:hypothetical protein
LKYVGFVWQQHMAESRHWAKARVVNRAHDALNRARCILSDVKDPVRHATDLLTEALICLCAHGADMDKKQIDNLYEARSVLAEAFGSEEHHLIAATDICIAKARGERNTEEEERGRTFFMGSVVKNHWLCDVPRIRSGNAL